MRLLVVKNDLELGKRVLLVLHRYVSIHLGSFNLRNMEVSLFIGLTVLNQRFFALEDQGRCLQSDQLLSGVTQRDQQVHVYPFLKDFFLVKILYINCFVRMNEHNRLSKQIFFLLLRRKTIRFVVAWVKSQFDELVDSRCLWTSRQVPRLILHA